MTGRHGTNVRLLGRLSDARARRIGLVVLIAATFAFGGGSRSDIASLILLRPLACLFSAYAVVLGSRDDLRRYAGMWLFGAALAFIAAAHLVPLPPALWRSLPGREIVVQVDALTGLGNNPRPLTLNATDGLNALYSLCVPAAVLAMVAVQRTDWRRTALYLILLLGAVSMVLSLLQVLGPANGPFYTYRITNGSSPVGLFANRNHNAVFLACLLPAFALLGVDGSLPHRGQRDWRPLRRSFSWIGAVLAIFFVLSSGSRAGLLLAGLSALMTPFVLGSSLRAMLLPDFPAENTGRHRAAPAPSSFKRYWRLAAVAILASGIVIVAAFSRLGGAAKRLTGEGDNRTEVWDAAVPMVGKYFPWGSGNGSFVDVFKLDEPYDLLSPKYVNHAHNDVLEVALTMGLPGMILMAIFLAFLARSGMSLWSSRADTSFTARIRRLGYVVLVLLPLASFVDYPLRTPAMMAVSVIAAAWLTGGAWPVSLAGSRRT